MQSSRKQPSRRLEKRENSRRWLLIPALCAGIVIPVQFDDARDFAHDPGPVRRRHSGGGADRGAE